METAQTSHQLVTSMCLGCRAWAHRGGYKQCQAYNQACLHCRKLELFGKVCQGKQGPQSITSGALSHHVSTNTMCDWICKNQSKSHKN